MNPGAVEVALVVVWWEGIDLDGGDVVDVPTGASDVHVLDEIYAVSVGCLAGLIDCVIAAGKIGISFGCECPAIEYSVSAADVGPVEIVDSLLVGGLVDGLYAISVVVCHCEGSHLLGQEIHAAIDDAEGVKMNDKGISCLVDRAVCNAHVLFLEEGRESRSVTTTVGFGEDGYRVVVWFVIGELLEPCLGEMPECSSSVFGRV